MLAEMFKVNKKLLKIIIKLQFTKKYQVDLACHNKESKLELVEFKDFKSAEMNIAKIFRAKPDKKQSRNFICGQNPNCVNWSKNYLVNYLATKIYKGKKISTKATCRHKTKYNWDEKFN